jgi:hypothetical protein
MRSEPVYSFSFFKFCDISGLTKPTAIRSGLDTAQNFAPFLIGNFDDAVCTKLTP